MRAGVAGSDAGAGLGKSARSGEGALTGAGMGPCGEEDDEESDGGADGDGGGGDAGGGDGGG
jgi:hypothetical protein